MALPNSQYIAVSYDGTDKGPIYLADIGPRYGLAGSNFNLQGQDRYINHDDVIKLVLTEHVALSIEKGQLKKLSDAGTVSINYNIAGVTFSARKTGSKRKVGKSIGEF